MMSKIPLTHAAFEMLLLEDSERGMKAVGKALVALAGLQTKDERASQRSKYHNNVGFNSVDARIGVDNANFFSRNGYLEDVQLKYWRTPDRYGNVRICKYIEQLLTVARRKAGIEREAVQLRLPL
jgi:catechol-2,3-dioxygenase